MDCGEPRCVLGATLIRKQNRAVIEAHVALLELGLDADRIADLEMSLRKKSIPEGDDFPVDQWVEESNEGISVR